MKQWPVNYYIFTIVLALSLITLVCLNIFINDSYTAATAQMGTSNNSFAPSAYTPHNITLIAISTEFNSPIGIDTHEASNQVIMSVNYVGSGQPYNFELVDSNGRRTQFSNTTGLTDEVKIATVRDSFGGFKIGEFFVGNGKPGEIVRISPDGAFVQNPWVVLPEEMGLLRGSLHVDRTGIFGGDLIIVTTHGGVWRVNSQGNHTLLAKLNTHLEGVTTLPDDTMRYGPWAGKILAGAEGQKRIYSIDPQGKTVYYELGIAPEDIDRIPANQNFFGVDYGKGRLVGAPASEFVGMVGGVLIAEEYGAPLWVVHWDASRNAFDVSEIARAGQWEHVTFSPAGIKEIAPMKQMKEERY